MSSGNPSNGLGRGRGRGKGRGQKNRQNPGRDSDMPDSTTKKPGHKLQAQASLLVKKKSSQQARTDTLAHTKDTKNETQFLDQQTLQVTTITQKCTATVVESTVKPSHPPQGSVELVQSPSQKAIQPKQPDEKTTNTKPTLRLEAANPTHPQQHTLAVQSPRQEGIQPSHTPQQASINRGSRHELTSLAYQQQQVTAITPPVKQIQLLSTGHSQGATNIHKGPKNYHGKKQPPERPGYGTLGRKFKVRSNYFLINLPHQLTIHQYNKSIGPREKHPKWLSRLIFQSMEARYSTDVFHGQKAAFDGSKILYCKKRLQLEGDKMSLPVDIKAEGEDRVQNFTVTIQYATTLNIDFDRIQELMSDATQRMPLVQALDVIMRHTPSMRLESDNRSFFSCPARPFNLGQGLEVWPGYYQSVRPTMGWRFMLNLDISSTAFYTKQSVIDFMCTLLKGGRGKDATSRPTVEDREKYTRKPMSEEHRRQLVKGITGVTIKVTHMSYSRKYKVVGVTNLSAHKQTFQLDTGRKMTVAEYFKETYPKSPLSYPHLPCLHVGQKTKNIYIPIEFCEIVGQRCVKKLSELQTAQMIRYVTKPADERERMIMESLNLPVQTSSIIQSLRNLGFLLVAV